MTIEAGTPVVIRYNGKPMAIGKCSNVMVRQVRIYETFNPWDRSRYGGNYLKRGVKVGDPQYTFEPIAADEVAAFWAAIQHDFESDIAKRNAEESARAQAAYDALTEAVKLARCLRWLCDCESEKRIAEAPIEHLRGLVEWAKEQGLTTE